MNIEHEQRTEHPEVNSTMVLCYVKHRNGYGH